MKRKLKNFLMMEEKMDMKKIHNKIIEFFKKNKNPSDKEVHEFAEKIGMDEHKFEEHIYMVLSDLINKKEMNEMLSLNPIDIKKISPDKRDLQMLRFSIIAEYDAASLYEQFAEMSINSDVKELMLDIAREEKVHIGEFEYLLEELDPEHEPAEEEGEEEIEGMMGENNEII